MPDEKLSFRRLDAPDTVSRLIRNLREGIYITDLEGEIQDANPAFLEIFGVSALAELSPYQAGDLVVGSGRRAEEMEQLKRDGAVRNFELELRRPDGDRRTVLDTCYLVTDPETGEQFCHGILIDITERKELERQLQELAVRDPLTGCFNRRHLAEVGLKLESRGPSLLWGAIVIDIDHFKAYNDEHGHAAGDDALVRLSRFLMRLVRAQDPVVRLGGDEFLVLLLEDSARSIREVARRFLEASKTQAPVSFSLGWAERRPGERLQETIDRADQKLLEARFDERGRGKDRRSR